MNILWWEEDTASGVASRITLLAEVQSGFTRRLKSNKHGSFRVLIDGPYGKSKDMEHYDSFLFVCTGIGITAQLLYIKELISKQRHGYRLRKVLLIWQVEERDHGEWIKQYMDLLLDLDKGTDFVSNHLE
jgi:predicted ferric reductase